MSYSCVLINKSAAEMSSLHELIDKQFERCDKQFAKLDEPNRQTNKQIWRFDEQNEQIKSDSVWVSSKISKKDKLFRRYVDQTLC